MIQNQTRSPDLLLMTLALLVLFAGCFCVSVWSENRINKGNDSHQRFFLMADRLRQSSDDLTRAKVLKLEQTGSMLVESVVTTITKMGALEVHGVVFLPDDFGCSDSSWDDPKRLPLDLIKIDQGLVRNIVTDINDAALAKTVVAAKSLGLSTIAERVELQAPANFLGHLGYQGYLFSKPLHLDAMEAVLHPTLEPFSLKG
jgi:EAL domain-containing protein (putative c-di-GMP-specific phosphodiesterase class I)